MARIAQASAQASARASAQSSVDTVNRLSGPRSPTPIIPGLVNLSNSVLTQPLETPTLNSYLPNENQGELCE